MQRAEAAGFEALVLTVDAPVHGARDRERRAGFRLPAGVSAVNLRRRAAARTRRRRTLRRPAAAPRRPGTTSTGCAARTRLPLLLKGVLHPDDARQARRRTAWPALIVSNHGGRTLDTALPTAWALPRIADAVGGALPLLVDGGIRRGTDVLKALALGARAVLIGRPYVHALAVGGRAGRGACAAPAARRTRDRDGTFAAARRSPKCVAKCSSSALGALLGAP